MCFVPDLQAYTQQGEFMSVSITSINNLNGVSTGYRLVFFRYIHRKNRIFLILPLCVFTQQAR